LQLSPGEEFILFIFIVVNKKLSFFLKIYKIIIFF